MRGAKDPVKKRRRKWTPEQVIAGLQEFYGSPGNTPGSPSPQSLEITNPPLHGGARREFGSLKAAMEAAGLPYPPHPPSPWNKDTLLQALRRMHAEGRDLSLSAVKDRHNGSLLGPALRHFGSWRKALEAGGIDYSAVIRVRQWTREEVLQELRKRYAEGKEMGGGAIQKQDVRLWAAAKRHFGTYLAALEFADIPVERPPEEWSWTPQQYQEAIRRLHEAGVDLSSGRIRRTHYELFSAARARMGSWQQAVESAGLDYNAIRRARDWSRESVIQRLRELHAAGAELRAGIIQKTDIPLSGAVQRYFGGLHRAMEAAGLPYPEAASGSVGHWTEELVLKTLRDMHAQGKDLRHSQVKRKHQSLFFAAKKLFGSYANAVVQAGINYWQMSQAQVRLERQRRTAAAGEMQEAH